MATWSDDANTQMSSLKIEFRLSDAQVNALRRQIGQWADTVGKEKIKDFQTPAGHALRVTAVNHEITSIQV